MKWFGLALMALVVVLVAGALQVAFRYEHTVIGRNVVRVDRLTGEVITLPAIGEAAAIEQLKAEKAALTERLDLITDENEHLHLIAAENERLRKEVETAIAARITADERAAAFQRRCP